MVASSEIRLANLVPPDFHLVDRTLWAEFALLKVVDLIEWIYSSLMIPRLEKSRSVCDNLNTHNIASLYEAFPAAEAHRLARRLEIYHTPGNGSWLNVAEIELSILSKQCLDRRIPTTEQLHQELSAWNQERNQTASKVIWHFSTEDARVKLQHLYPVFETVAHL